jgi:hypothetical protein
MMTPNLTRRQVTILTLTFVATHRLHDGALASVDGTVGQVTIETEYSSPTRITREEG